jgi:hypothetical protein
VNLKASSATFELSSKYHGFSECGPQCRAMVVAPTFRTTKSRQIESVVVHFFQTKPVNHAQNFEETNGQKGIYQQQQSYFDVTTVGRDIFGDDKK